MVVRVVLMLVLKLVDCEVVDIEVERELDMLVEADVEALVEADVEALVEADVERELDRL